MGWAYLVSVIDCCTREIVGWNLSHRCRTEEALDAVEQAVLERLPVGSREMNLTLTTDNGAIHVLAVHGDTGAAGYHASPYGASPPGCLRAGP